MTNPVSYRRPAFPARPWITGALYDLYSADVVLHCDAYVFEYHYFQYLTIDWREGGHKLIASDTWLIEPEGLTPVWDARRDLGRNVYWTRRNAATMARVHKTVLAQAPRMMELTRGRYARVVAQAHYVHVRNVSGEIDGNAYKPPRPYAPRKRAPMPDIL